MAPVVLSMLRCAIWLSIGYFSLESVPDPYTYALVRGRPSLSSFSIMIISIVRGREGV